MLPFSRAPKGSAPSLEPIPNERTHYFIIFNPIFLIIGFMLFLILLNTGCAASSAAPTHVTLQYSLAENEKVPTSLSGLDVNIIPFQDGRTDPYIYRQQLVLADGQNPGVWVANAIKIELEHSGAKVIPMPTGTPPSTGLHLTGQVALLKARATGWGLGGILAALIETGYAPHITLSVQVHEEGIPILGRQYDLQKNVPSNVGYVLMFARPPAVSDVPPAFGVVLKKLIREQIIPDLAKVAQDRLPHTTSSSGEQ